MNAPPTKRDQIVNEPPGRKLDRWVGEIVLEMRVVRARSDTGDGWVYNLVSAGGKVGEGRPTPEDAWGDCPAFSTDVAAAIEVAASSSHSVEIRRIRHRDTTWRWMAHVRFSSATGEANCERLPLAICRAALLSKLSL